MVVFETLFQGETAKSPSHEDIEDEGQTVTFIGEPTNRHHRYRGRPAHCRPHRGNHHCGRGGIHRPDSRRNVHHFRHSHGQSHWGSLSWWTSAEVTAEVEFTPESAGGTVELTYTLDASTLAGTTIVVFETLYSDGVEIAAHTDINDEAQTVEITEPEKPTLGTTATVDGQHTADPTGEITIVDVVEYTGLTPRQDVHRFRCPYRQRPRAKPLLVDGAESHRRNGVRARGSAAGTVELDLHAGRQHSWQAPPSWSLKRCIPDGVEVAAHADINDEGPEPSPSTRKGELAHPPEETLEDGVLEGSAFLVEGEGYSETFIYGRRRERSTSRTWLPGEYTVTEQESDLTARYEIPAGPDSALSPQTRPQPWSSTTPLLRGKITGHKTGAEQAPLEGVTFGLFRCGNHRVHRRNCSSKLPLPLNESGEFTFEAPYGNVPGEGAGHPAPGLPVTMKEPIAVEVNAADVELEPIANTQTDSPHFSKVDAETGEELARRCLGTVRSGRLPSGHLGNR